MWAWGFGGLATAGGVAFVMAGGPACHCGPCLGRATAADGGTVMMAAPPRPVRFDEPPLAKPFRTPPPAILPVAHTEPARRYSAPGDPF